MHVNGYHGTTRASGQVILRQGFRASSNDYDWLGDGVYFFQDAPARARQWAVSQHGTEAAVVRSVIGLEDCMDLVDVSWAKVLPEMYNAFLGQLKRANLPIPQQSSGAHRLDRAVINYAVGLLAEQGVVVRCVRGAFAEGSPVFPGSAIFDRAHVQIAVRDTSLIEASEILDDEVS